MTPIVYHLALADASRCVPTCFGHASGFLPRSLRGVLGFPAPARHTRMDTCTPPGSVCGIARAAKTRTGRQSAQVRGMDNTRQQAGNREHRLRTSAHTSTMYTPRISEDCWVMGAMRWQHRDACMEWAYMSRPSMCVGLACVLA